jgi:adenylate kinase family enzyme
MQRIPGRPVIAIAGPIGSGKSALTSFLAQKNPGSDTVHFDDYERATRRPVDELAGWIQRGADFNEFLAPGLAEHLLHLKHLPTTSPIFFEMPLGRAYAATAPFIDRLLWLDTPLDLALARKLKKFTSDFAQNPDDTATRDHLRWIRSYLDNYLAIVRQVLVIQERKIAPQADLILDGNLPFDRLVEKAVSEIRSLVPGL